MSRRSQRLSPVLVLACVGITVLHEASPQPNRVLEGTRKIPQSLLGNLILQPHPQPGSSCSLQLQPQGLCVQFVPSPECGSWHTGDPPALYNPDGHSTHGLTVPVLHHLSQAVSGFFLSRLFLLAVEWSGCTGGHTVVSATDPGL